MNGDRDERQTPPPMNDEEFAHWWRSFDDNDLDKFEREIEESLKDCEILPDPNWEEKSDVSRKWPDAPAPARTRRK